MVLPVWEFSVWLNTNEPLMGLAPLPEPLVPDPPVPVPPENSNRELPVLLVVDVELSLVVELIALMFVYPKPLRPH